MMGMEWQQLEPLRSPGTCSPASPHIANFNVPIAWEPFLPGVNVMHVPDIPKVGTEGRSGANYWAALRTQSMEH